MVPTKESDIESRKNPTKMTDTNKKKKTAKEAIDGVRILEMSVLSLVVISNLYFGYVLTSGGVSAAGTSVSESTTTSASNLAPATVPKMVGGC